MVKLNQILLLGKIVPEPLQLCIRQIASPQIRNIATIGGNICYPKKCLDTLAPLAALDAQYELRSPLSARWISASRFSAGLNALNPQELLTRIRIPLDQWDYSVFKKYIAASGAHRVIVFMLKSQKNLLTDARALINSDSVYRDKNSESLLIGKQLPLNRRDLPVFLESWDTFLANTPDIDSFTLDRMHNFIDQAIHALCE
jgi:CO/xanthine dehydrogenase FAD-binding subunit